MSEKLQRTAASMREKMIHRYGDEVHHKHDKYHNSYRQHYRSHPVTRTHVFDQLDGEGTSTGLLRAFKLRKVRKRLDKGHVH